jgi:hypothetical protein
MMPINKLSGLNYVNEDGLSQNMEMSCDRWWITAACPAPEEVCAELQKL